MANIVNSTSQYNFTGRGYLDKKMGPFKTLDELLKAGPSRFLIDGMVAMVMEGVGSRPTEYLRQNGQWVPYRRITEEEVNQLIDNKIKDIKAGGVEISGKDMETPVVK